MTNDEIFKELIKFFWIEIKMTKIIEMKTRFPSRFSVFRSQPPSTFFTFPFIFIGQPNLSIWTNFRVKNSFAQLVVSNISEVRNGNIDWNIIT